MKRITIKSKQSYAPGPCVSCGINLLNVWYVVGNENYDIRRKFEVSNTLIAIRTLKGCGELFLKDFYYNRKSENR